ncbi:hypothetical protein EGR_03541 [Echinococcus granulosus]|uniref:Uncharacterized protein n=1 Tax=Echinococcus granulosus TaxID=6210 RepID=W6UT14_ECHGR|nr:hypothetical protein EGR_03541 [Echinococcus granulosus]EUB61477.1 hypothetical protein EGR_03541 [Echinococcus granulosus]
MYCQSLNIKLFFASHSHNLENSQNKCKFGVGSYYRYIWVINGLKPYPTNQRCIYINSLKKLYMHRNSYIAPKFKKAKYDATFLRPSLRFLISHIMIAPAAYNNVGSVGANNTKGLFKRLFNVSLFDHNTHHIKLT